MWEWLKRLFGWRPEPTAPAAPPAPIPEEPKPAPVTPPKPPMPSIPPPIVQPSSLRVCGLDVARYQDKLDPTEWKLLFEKGYRYVYAKATDGEAGTDSFYNMHRRGAKEAGFLFGAYHFFRFGHDPLKQARHFFNASGGCKPGELPPVLDVEWDRFTADGKYGKDKRMDDAAVSLVFECLVTIEYLFGITPIIYTNAYFWPETIKNPERFKRFLCWIPAYSDSHNPGGVHHLVGMKPELLLQAGDKVKVPYPWKQWTFWQDDDDLAVGDVKAIDTDVFRGSLEDLRKLCKT